MRAFFQAGKQNPMVPILAGDLTLIDCSPISVKDIADRYSILQASGPRVLLHTAVFLPHRQSYSSCHREHKAQWLSCEFKLN